MTLSIIAIILSAVAIGVSIWTGLFNKRSAVAAEKSLSTSQEAAGHAKDSAEHAKASADAAVQVARAEVDRDHKAMEPVFNGQFKFEPRRNNPNTRALMYLFSLDHGYTVRAWVSRDNGSSYAEASVTAPDRADGTWKVHVEDWSPDRRERQWEKLELRFWPPQVTPGRAAPWTCRCGLEVNPGDHPGHWDWTLPVEPPKRLSTKVHSA